jgi:hypothetical protein
MRFELISTALHKLTPVADLVRTCIGLLLSIVEIMTTKDLQAQKLRSPERMLRFFGL